MTHARPGLSGRSPFEEMPTIPGSTSEPKLVARAEITETVPEFAAGPPEFNPPPGYFDLPAPDKKDGTDPPIITNGQVIAIEILEALPGRPLNGDRVVRPDGTISLGFYGDLRVAGLNRYQIKVKLIEHMRRYLNDEILGLWRIDPATNKYEPVPPVESGRVLVDESPNYHPAGIGKTPRQSTMEDLLSSKPQIDELRGEIARLRKELNDLREEQKSPRAEPPVAASKPG